MENLILLIAKWRLKPVVLEKHPLYPVYKKYLPLLETCLKEAYYWHGTGRYHYLPKGNSKYEGVDFSKTYDVLQSIIDTGGITPKFDPIVDINGQYGNSISLAKHRIYGRVYAEFNQYEKNDFRYTYGSPKFWFYVLFPLTMLQSNLLQNIISYLHRSRGKEFLKQSQFWTNSLRKPGPIKWTPLNFYKVRSDIPENYGLLFGIKKEGVHAFPIHPAVDRFETRADNLIKLEDLTHIEVAIDKVEEVESVLKRNKINIPVIPLEVAELYCSRYSLAYLIGVINDPQLVVK